MLELRNFLPAAIRLYFNPLAACAVLALVGLTSLASGQPVFIEDIGHPGASDGQFNNPYGLALDGSGNLFIADQHNNRVQKYDLVNGTLSHAVTFTNPGPLTKSPGNLALDSLGNVFVTYNGRDHIEKFSPSGGTYTSAYTFGQTGSATGEFSFVRGIAINSNDQIHIADYSNDRVQVFTDNGTSLDYVFSYSGSVDKIQDIAFDDTNRIYTVDDPGDDIQKFIDLGGFVAFEFSAATQSSGNGIAVDHAGNVYVAGGRVRKLAPVPGNLTVEYTIAGSSGGGVAVDQFGNLYYSSENTDQIHRWFDPDAIAPGQTATLANFKLHANASLGNIMTLEAGKVMNVLNATALEAGSSLTIDSGATFSTLTLGIVGGSYTGSLTSVGNIVFVSGALDATGAGGLSFDVGGPLGATFEATALKTVSVEATTTVGVGGALTVSGGLFETGALTGAGTVSLTGGELAINGPTGHSIGSGPLGNALVLTATQTLTVANLATIESGASVTLDGGTLSVGDLDIIGTLNFNTGTLAITGSQGLSISSSGQLGATVNIISGQTLRVDGDIDIPAGGLLNVDDPGRLEWADAKTMNVTGSGRVEIDGGLLQGFHTPDDSVINVIGPASEFAITTANFDTTLYVEKDAQINVSAGGELKADYLFLLDGQITVEGSGSRFDLTAGTKPSFHNRIGSGSGNTGVLRLADGATGSLVNAANSRMEIAFTSGGTGRVEVFSGAALEIPSLVRIGSQGQMIIDGGNSLVSQMSGASLSVAGKVIVRNGGRYELNANTLSVGEFGEVQVASGGTMVIGDGLSSAGTGVLEIVSGGRLSGEGTITASVVNTAGEIFTEGTASIGTMTFVGDVAFEQASSLFLEVNDNNTAGDDYGELDISGNFAAGGTLDLQFDGYTPALNNQLNIIRVGGTIVGQFDEVKHVAQSGNLGLAVRYDFDAGEVDVRVSMRGDVDFDDDVDTSDLTRAIIGFNGASSSGNSWVRGDFDGDGDTDTSDLTTAIVNFTGASALNADVPDLIYDPNTGNVTLDTEGRDVISFSLQGGPFNMGNIDFSGLPAGLTDNITEQIGWTSFNIGAGLVGTADLGAILPTGLSEARFLAAFAGGANYGLSVVTGGGGAMDLIYVPEPASIVLLGLGALMVVRRRHRPIA